MSEYSLCDLRRATETAECLRLALPALTRRCDAEASAAPFLQRQQERFSRAFNGKAGDELARVPRRRSAGCVAEVSE